MKQEATKETVGCGIKQLKLDQIYLQKSLSVTCQVKLKEERMKTQDVMSNVCFFSFVGCSVAEQTRSHLAKHYMLFTHDTNTVVKLRLKESNYS